VTIRGPVYLGETKAPLASVCSKDQRTMSNKGFSDTQKLYLEGLASGLRAQLKKGAPKAAGLSLVERGPGGAQVLASTARAEARDTGFEHARRAARARLTEERQRACAEDRAKDQVEPDEMWGRMLRMAKAGQFPTGEDLFRYKFHGLFYTAPTEDAFMCRLRFPAGVVTAHQLAGVADLAEAFARPELQLTTRSNVQLRGIAPSNAMEVLTRLYELGVQNRGAGADGVRNVLASPTAGFDRQELIDARPLAREAHHFLLACRHVHALPRKFLVAFDGGGTVGVAPEVSDLGFRAVYVNERSASEPEGERSEEGALPEGVYFRLLLGGSPSHGRFARDAGVVVAPEHCLAVLEAVLQIYMEFGDRTNRRRARLVYLLESWGIQRFLQELGRRLDFELPEVSIDACTVAAPRPLAHLGFHNQKPRGLSYVGVFVKDGVLSAQQARGLARIASEFGAGELSLTRWHSVLIPHLKDTQIHRVKDALAALGLSWSATKLQSGLVACTGSAGCKFGLADTKHGARELVGKLEQRLKLDAPLHLHISGCHHGCAQQLTADIGLLATSNGADTAGKGPAFDISIGGREGPNPTAARLFAQRVATEELPELLAELLEVYSERRLPEESFHDFVGRVPAADLRRWARRKSRAEGSSAES
jgi:ferredoxin-nitrite reductase